MEIKEIKFGSVCSGIEAASVAWEPLGWRAAWLSEIEPFPCSVLSHHWPHVKNLGDMTTIKERIRAGDIEAPAVFTGGTPCQAFSVAGKRGSLSDERGNLSLEFCEIANAIDDIRRDRGEQPSIIVWENVPGVLSTNDNAFGCFLAGIAGDDQPLEPGPRPEQGRSSTHWTWKKDAGEHVPKWPDAGVAAGPVRTVTWRVLDAQYFGLAQRRRRVFVVASARKGFDPGAVLLEFEGVRRDSPPSREAGQSVAGTLDASPWGGSFHGTDGACAGHVQTPVGDVDSNGIQHVVGTLCADTHPGAYSGQDAYTGRLVPHVYAVHGTQDPGILHEQAHTLGRNSGQENAVLGIYENQRSELRLNDVIGTIQCAGGKPGQGYPATLVGMRVRRLTPVECERLQGFNDNHTLVPHRGKPAADGPRYKALGNSWAVNCARWIGYRIAKQC